MRVSTPDMNILGNRYLIDDILGQGGMGIVYRATDRLTGQSVALKRVLSKTQDLVFSSRSEGINIKLALAKEFRMLSSLRHPNIISVLDYGFDQERQPFFTMELIENPRSILDEGTGKPISEKLNLVIQILQAIAYLHRRGIIHSDLKPSNVLVHGGQARVLDFGLSVSTDSNKDGGGTTGTLAYLAPEVLLGKPISKAADLYAVGIIAYQLLAGRHPFNTDNITQLIQEVTHTPVDLSRLDGVEESVRLVIGRLLDKDPEGRYPSASDVIRALSEALDQPLPTETEAIRDSYLQAARLVGRDYEMQQLEDWLRYTLEGRGSVLLIGGESGVGKSRLLDELRSLAMVRGALVLRGQSVSAGGQLYGLWRPMLRWLALITNLSTEEASILKPLIPDLETLLGRSLPDAPEIDPKQAQTRLFETIEAMLRRHATEQKQPVVIILEDLHWASESLDILRHIQTFVSELPLLIIGSYRDDERPSLPGELPGAEVMRLERLSGMSIAELTESMLGEAGKQPKLVSLLERETEGNVFFLVEVVRALAEEVGQLDRIAQMDLPTNVFAGGMQQIIQRRLDQVPSFARPLLQVASVAGRYLDMKILKQIDPGGDLSQWLTLCSNVAVLEVYEERWRFAHDKLRDGILGDLESEHLKNLHETVAKAIEAAYPDRSQQATALAHHWRKAEIPARAAHYAELAGDQAMRGGAHLEAQSFYQQALEAVRQLPEDDDRKRKFIDLMIKLSRASAYNLTEDLPQLMQEARAVAEQLQDEQRLARIIASTGAYYYMRGQLGTAFPLFIQSMGLAEKLGLDELLVLPYNILSRGMSINGELMKSIPMMRRGIELAYRFNEIELAVGSEAFLAATLIYMGNLEEARPLAALSLQHAVETGWDSRVAGNHMALGFSLTMVGDLAQAQNHVQQVFDLLKETPNHPFLFVTSASQGYIYFWQGELDLARQYVERGLALAHAQQIAVHLPLMQTWIIEIDLMEGHLEGLEERLAAALELGKKLRQLMGQAETLRVMGKLAAVQQKWELAEQYYNESLAVWGQCDAPPLVERSRIGLAEMLYKKGDHARAIEILKQALEAYKRYEMTDFRYRAEELLVVWEQT